MTTTIGPDARLDQLLASLSLEQKVRLLTGADLWSTWPEPQIGLRRIVVSDGPADQAGLRAGDVITGLNNADINSPTDLSNVINQFHPGDKATLTWIDQSGQQQSGTVTFGTGPPA